MEKVIKFSDGESDKAIFSSSMSAGGSSCKLSRGVSDNSCGTEVDLEP